MDTKLWNQASDGFTSEFSLGGLPIFTEDLQMMQDNSTELYGMLSLLKGWACIVRGCLVDEVNISSRTIKVLPGVVILNDKLYDFPGYEGTYPFSIVPSGPTNIDTRIFKDGNAVDVATTYATGIRTSFSPGNNDGTLRGTVPTDLTTTEIYFDPYTAQKAEYILANNALMRGEMKQLWKSSTFTRTETGRDMVGGSLDFFVGNYCRWKYLGWVSHSNSGQFVLRNRQNEDPTGFGSNSIRLTKDNLPEHQHSEAGGFDGSLQATLAGNHDHTIQTDAASAQAFDGGFDPGQQMVNPSGSRNTAGATNTTGEHTHNISGKSGKSDETWGGTADSFDVRGYSLYCLTLEFRGLGSISFPSFFTGTRPYSNM
jgi:hypothetical protein